MRSFCVGFADPALGLLILRWFCGSCVGFVYFGLGFIDFSLVLYLVGLIDHALSL